MASFDIPNLYLLCKEEMNDWLLEQEWWTPYKYISEITSIIINLLELAEKCAIWEKGYLYNVLKPKIKKEFETYGLPYLESLAEHYVDDHLPFQNELVEEIVNDNVKRIIDEIYERLEE